MEYYNNKGEKYNFKFENPFNSGTTSNIYKLENNKCVKLYENTGKFSRISTLDTNIINIIQNLNSDNMGKIYEILYDNYNKYHRLIKGYIMEYYEQTINNIFEEDVDYLLDNLNFIYKIVMELSNNMILMNDSHYYKNVILTNDKIILIDFDDYRFEHNRKKEYVKEENIKCIIRLFMNILRKHNKDNKVIENYFLEMKIHKLFSFRSNLIDSVSNELKSYKKTIDYFNKVHI